MIAVDTNIPIYAHRGETELHEAAVSQLVALCLEHGIDTVLTNDRDFDRFEPLQVRRLE